MSESKELTVSHESAFLSMVERLASMPDINVDAMRQVLDMQERVLDREAKLAYATAMSDVQADLDKHIATNRNNTQTHSRYADLAQILNVAKPIYTRHGFSMEFYEGETSKVEHLRVVAEVKHRGGHTELRHLDVPVVTTGIKGTAMMTATHATTSAFSYGRRTLSAGILNIATGDDDGNAASQVAESLLISDEDAAWIKEKLRTLGVDTKTFLAFLEHTGAVDNLPKNMVGRAKNALIAKEKKLANS